MAGLLADVYSFGDTLKRKARGLLADPVGTLQQFVGNENDRAGRFNELTAQATDERVNRIKSGGKMGPNEQKLAGLLADAYNPTGMFIGASAKTWDKAAAEKAQKMLKAGVDPRQVWKETGTFKGADGALRQEIDDSLAMLDDRSLRHYEAAQAITPWRMDKVSGVLSHRPAYGAYKDLQDIGLDMTKEKKGGSYAAATSWGDPEVIALGPDSGKSTMLHEIQHAIQQREGWAKGGSPETAFIERNLSDLTPLVDPKSIYASGAKTATQGPIMVVSDEGKLLITDGNHRYAEALRRGDKTIRTHFDPTFFAGYSGNIDQAVKDAANENYKRLAGEAEARATQARMNMNAAQRREVYPFDSYDVPVDQLIVRGGLLGN